MRKRKLKIIGLTALMVLITFVTTLSFVNKAQASNAMRPGTAASSQGEDDPEVPPSTADHSKFEILQQDFATGPEVTAACLSCHTEASTQVMHTTHWTWEYVNETTGQTVGKKTELNNFCIGTSSNEPRCTSCHIGYGWEDDSFDFDVAENVDCLICHDTTGTYTKPATKAGLPDPDVDLSFIAQSIGETSRANCLACHANGGGGDAVKHGDIDTSLIEPNHDLDVHMDADGLNFSCSECHITDSHAISGSRYEHDENVKTCADCHDAAPHEEETLNTHAEKLACQSCHIPEFARGDIPTKMTWDWSTAGKKTEDGEILIEKDEDGHTIYHSFKGDFTYGEDVVPEYIWSNGTAEYTLISDSIDPSQIVSINKFMGDISDPSAKIWPVKRFTGKQPYDSVNNTLIVPHVFGDDSTAYWTNFDWAKAIEAGMKSAGAPYSGEFGFVETEMYWPITHMVSPSSETVECQECHEENGRIDFSALGYSEDRIEELIWTEDGYPGITEATLAKLVSRPKEGNSWTYWLLGVIAIIGVFEVAVTRHLGKKD